MLLKRYSCKKRFQKMSYDDKRVLQHWLFDGEDQTVIKYSVYLSVTGKANKVDNFIYGRIMGLRTLKGGNINYQEENNKYMTNIVTYDIR